MTDLEFLERLRRELTTSPAWSDVGRIVGAADDPALAENELRVYEVQSDPTMTALSVFRVIVEWEVGDAREVDPTHPPFIRNSATQPDEEPDGN